MFRELFGGFPRLHLVFQSRPEGEPDMSAYVVAAKFVIDKFESAADIQKLARQIVDTILQNEQVVEEKAPSQTRSGAGQQ
jgi:hypothetical protein